jgi:glycosyltransferase involved in cell wall biosynthesis
MMARAAVFCAPSKVASSGWAEAFGLVSLEAASAGMPVVAYQSGGVAEAVEAGVTGLLVAEGDVTELSERLGGLLTDPGLASSMGAAGQRRACRDFDIKRRSQLLEEVYDAVAQEPGIGPGGAHA